MVKYKKCRFRDPTIISHDLRYQSFFGESNFDAARIYTCLRDAKVSSFSFSSQSAQEFRVGLYIMPAPAALSGNLKLHIYQHLVQIFELLPFNYM